MEEDCYLISKRKGVDYCTAKDGIICTLVTELVCGVWEQIKKDEKAELDKGVGA